MLPKIFTPYSWIGINLTIVSRHSKNEVITTSQSPEESRTSFPLTTHVIGFLRLHNRTPDLMAGIPDEAPENDFW